MKKKICLFLLCLLSVIACALDLSACGEETVKKAPEEATEETTEETVKKATDGLSYVLNGDSYSCNGIGTSTETEIVIASEYNGYSVTSIEEYAFEGCSSLTSIMIPDSVTSVGNRAFSHCSSLTNVTIPDSVTSVGTLTFWDCTSLRNITLPESVTFISDSVFFGCYQLRYNEYENANYLGNDNNPYVALISAKSIYITTCTINNNTKIIATNAFEDCSLLTSIVIPDGVMNIGELTFHGCSALKNITIPDSMESSVFLNCNSLTIYCEAADNPSGWSADWNPNDRPVVWNYKG